MYPHSESLFLMMLMLRVLEENLIQETYLNSTYWGLPPSPLSSLRSHSPSFALVALVALVTLVTLVALVALVALEYHEYIIIERGAVSYL
jgi:hypothetical protein